MNRPAYRKYWTKHARVVPDSRFRYLRKTNASICNSALCLTRKCICTLYTEMECAVLRQGQHNSSTGTENVFCVKCFNLLDRKKKFAFRFWNLLLNTFIISCVRAQSVPASWGPWSINIKQQLVIIISKSRKRNQEAAKRHVLILLATLSLGLHRSTIHLVCSRTNVTLPLSFELTSFNCVLKVKAWVK